MDEIRAVVFDIGGVLVRTEDPRPRELLAQRYGLDRAGIDALVFGSSAAQAAELGRLDEQAVWLAVQERLGMSPDELLTFRDQFWAGDRLDVRLFGWLARLRPRYKTALLTNSWLRDPLTLFTGRFGQPAEQVSSALDAVVSSAAVGIRKPDPRIFQAVLDVLCISASEAIFVDDFEQNIAAASALGFHVVLFRSADQAAHQLHAMLGV